MDYEVIHDHRRIAAFVRLKDAQFFAEEVASRVDRELAAVHGSDHVYPVDIYVRQVIRLVSRPGSAILGVPE